jgi:transposase
VAFIVAVTVVAEVGDFRRFDNPRQLMAYSVEKLVLDRSVGR